MSFVADDDVGLGLVGHLPLDPFGPVCYAGHRGCANAMLTAGSIASAVSLAKGRPVDYDEALDLALAGDAAARRVAADAGHALGRFVALVANIALPRLVVVGGEGARLATVAEAQVREALDAHRKPGARPIEVVVQSGSLGEWARGAAVVAIQDHVGAR
ncbi:ROK family protein [Salana multivorans]